MPSTHLLPALISIVRDASQEILAVYEDEALQGQQTLKEDRSPLTLADQAAHQLIARRLSALTPSIPLLSEEGKHPPYETRKTWERFWLVDPLDGTKEFIKRNGEFTVNIALMEASRPLIGIVHVPVSGCTYYGMRGQGAFKRQADSEAQPLRVASFEASQSGLRVVCSRSHASEAVEAFLSGFDQPTRLSMGSSLKFMLLAEGKADVYPRLAPTMEWDTAAAHLIVEEAGGKVVVYPEQEPLCYNKPVLTNPHFIAYGDGSL